MPIKVKTMRDVWDKGKKKKKIRGCKIFPPEIEKYYFDYLARKRAFLEVKNGITKIFTDYERRLGDAGFFKI